MPSPAPSLQQNSSPSPSLEISSTPTVTQAFSPTALPTPTPTSSPTPLPTLSPSPTPISPLRSATNWAGYVAASDLQAPQPNVTGVVGSWTVPTILPSSNDTFSAIWIGIGGQFSDQTLIQCGTEQDSVQGQPTYTAWYELLPRSAVTIFSISVSPGDQIQASIQLVDDSFDQWSINMTDITSDGSFQRTFVYVSSQTSADWIIERPDINGVLSALSSFGNVTFSDCQATISSTFGGISSFPYIEIVMYSSTTPETDAVQLTDVSSLSPEGTSFTVSYLASE